MPFEKILPVYVRLLAGHLQMFQMGLPVPVSAMRQLVLVPHRWIGILRSYWVC